MEDDCRPLLSTEYVGESCSNRDSTESLDSKIKRPFHVEPRNIVDDAQQERVSAEAAILNSRVHYYSRLTGSSDRLLSPPNHVIPQPEEIYIYSPLGTAFKVRSSESSSKNPSIVTIFAVWNTMMGTSILSIPWGIKQAGFTLGILILIFTGLLMLYCCYIVLHSPKSIPYVDTSNWEFPDVCRFYLGKIGQWSSLVFSMVSLIGAMVIYWVLMSNFLYNSGQFIYNYVHHINVSDATLGTNGSEKVICPNPNTDWGGNSTHEMLLLTNSGNTSDISSFGHWWSKTSTVPLYLIVLLLPLLCFRSAAFFARFTFLGTVSVIYLIALVTVKAVHLGFHLDFHWFDRSQFYVPEFRLLFPQLTGVLTLAFFIHNCIITLMKSNRHQENNVRDLSVAYLLVGLTYLYVGVLIFAAFPSPPLSKECIEPVRPAFLLLDDTGRFLSFIQHVGSLSSARTRAHLVAFDSSVTHSSVYFYLCEDVHRCNAFPHSTPVVHTRHRFLITLLCSCSGLETEILNTCLSNLYFYYFLSYLSLCVLIFVWVCARRSSLSLCLDTDKYINTHKKWNHSVDCPILF